MGLIQNNNRTAKFSDRRDAIVLILGASRQDGEHITDAQKDAAMNAAKAVLQIAGADVDASSSAFLLSDPDFQEGDEFTVQTTVSIYKETEEEAEEEETDEEFPSELNLEGIDEAE